MIMKHFFILLIALSGLLYSCKEKNEDFPLKEPDVFFYKSEIIAPRDISCMIYNNDHDVFLGSENKDEVLHLGIHGREVISIQNPQNINPGITCILYDDLDRLWIGTDHGLFRYNNGKIESVPGFESRKINCLSKIWYLKVWIGMDAKENERSVVRIDKNDSCNYLKPDSNMDISNINSIALIAQNNGYFSTDDGKRYYFYDKNAFLQDQLSSNDYFTCSAVMNEHICFGTSSAYLYKTDNLTSLVPTPVFCSAAIKTLCYSHDTAIWIGTSGSGLIRYKDKNFYVYDKISAKIASDSILSVVPAGDKHILFSIPGGKVYLMPVNQ